VAVHTLHSAYLSVHFFGGRSTVNGQLTAQFNVEKNRAHTFYGLAARLYTKLTAHTLCTYINRLLDKADVLQIKQLAFPNI
jgi:hypothetical protein